jgi:hypothetical protein
MQRKAGLAFLFILAMLMWINASGGWFRTNEPRSKHSPPVEQPVRYSGEIQHLRRIDTSDGFHIIDAWLNFPNFAEARFIMQHPFSVIRTNAVNATTTLLRFWEDFSWKFVGQHKHVRPSQQQKSEASAPVEEERVLHVDANCQVFWEGHRHAAILHCPLAVPVSRGDLLEGSLIEMSQGLVVPNVTLGVEPHDTWNATGVVALCSSPLLNKGPYLAEWIEWHRVMGTEVRRTFFILPSCARK